MKEEYEKIIELLEFSHGKYSIGNIFSDFVVMFAIAIKNSLNYEQEDEDIYLQIIKKYDKSETKIFVKLVTELIEIFLQQRRDEVIDVLGEIYQKIGINSKELNQYFTPMNVAKAMSHVTLDNLANEDKEFITISDPTCGSGVMLLSVVDYMIENKMDYTQKILVVGQDIDLVCFCMTYIQLSLWNIPGVVVLGNSLVNERRKVFYTPQYFIGNWNEKLEKM